MVQMGNLLNGSVEKVDRIRNSLFENEHTAGSRCGTATVFMGDLRISTNVLAEEGIESDRNSRVRRSRGPGLAKRVVLDRAGARGQRLVSCRSTIRFVIQMAE